MKSGISIFISHGIFGSELEIVNQNVKKEIHCALKLNLEIDPSLARKIALELAAFYRQLILVFIGIWYVCPLKSFLEISRTLNFNAVLTRS